MTEYLRLDGPAALAAIGLPEANRGAAMRWARRNARHGPEGAQPFLNDAVTTLWLHEQEEPAQTPGGNAQARPGTTPSSYRALTRDVLRLGAPLTDMPVAATQQDAGRYSASPATEAHWQRIVRLDHAENPGQYDPHCLDDGSALRALGPLRAAQYSQQLEVLTPDTRAAIARVFAAPVERDESPRWRMARTNATATVLGALQSFLEEGGGLEELEQAARWASARVVGGIDGCAAEDGLVNPGVMTVGIARSGNHFFVTTHSGDVCVVPSKRIEGLVFLEHYLRQLYQEAMRYGYDFHVVHQYRRKLWLDRDVRRHVHAPPPSAESTVAPLYIGYATGAAVRRARQLDHPALQLRGAAREAALLSWYHHAFRALLHVRPNMARIQARREGWSYVCAGRKERRRFRNRLQVASA